MFHGSCHSGDKFKSRNSFRWPWISESAVIVAVDKNDVPFIQAWWRRNKARSLFGLLQRILYSSYLLYLCVNIHDWDAGQIIQKIQILKFGGDWMNMVVVMFDKEGSAARRLHPGCFGARCVWDGGCWDGSTALAFLTQFSPDSNVWNFSSLMLNNNEWDLERWLAFWEGVMHGTWRMMRMKIMVYRRIVDNQSQREIRLSLSWEGRKSRE